MRSAVESALDALARRALGEDAAAPALSGDEGHVLVAAAGRHNLLGTLAWAVADGWVDVGDADVTGRATDAMTNALVIEREALRCTRLLRSAGVAPVVVKGVAVAHLDWPDPCWRTFGDVDLLVPPSELDEAVAALEDEGFRRDLPERRPAFDRRFAKDLTVVEPGGPEVDLHRSLTDGPLGQVIVVDDLHEGTEAWTLGGEEVRTLGLARRVLHSAYGVTVSDDEPRLATIVDLGFQLCRADLDLDEVRRLASRWRAEAVLAEAVRVVAAYGNVPDELGQWASAHQPSRWEHVARATYRSGRGTNTSTLLGGVLGIRGWRARGAYLHGLLLPSAVYRDGRRARGRSGEWSTGLRELLLRRRSR